MAEFGHADANANRSWTLRVARGGNVYSFVGPFGEAMPPQAHKQAGYMLRARAIGEAMPPQNHKQAGYMLGARAIGEAMPPQNHKHAPPFITVAHSPWDGHA